MIINGPGPRNPSNDAAASLGEAAAPSIREQAGLEAQADRERDHVRGLLVAGVEVGHALHDRVEPAFGEQLGLAEPEVEAGAGVNAELGLRLARAQDRKSVV